MSDHVQRPRHRGWGWGSKGMGACTRKDDVARRPESVPEVAKAVPIQTIWNWGWGGICGVTTHPRSSQSRPSGALAGPSRPPSHSHRIPEHPLRSPLDPAGTSPPPGVLRGSPRSRPTGSIGWLTTRGRSSRASAPSPARATQDAASKPRPRGSGPRPDSAPGQRERRRRTGPFRSRLPRHSGSGGGKKSEPSFPRQRRSTPNPTPFAKYPLGRALNPCCATRPEGWCASGWGKGGGGSCASADDHFGVRWAIFISFSGLLQQLLVGKRKERNLPCVGAPVGSGAQQGHPRAKRRADMEEGTSRAEDARRETLGKRNPNEKHTAHRGCCERAAAAAGGGSGSKDHI